MLQKKKQAEGRLRSTLWTVGVHRSLWTLIPRMELEFQDELPSHQSSHTPSATSPHFRILLALVLPVERFQNIDSDEKPN